MSTASPPYDRILQLQATEQSLAEELSKRRAALQSARLEAERALARMASAESAYDDGLRQMRALHDDMSALLTEEADKVAALVDVPIVEARGRKYEELELGGRRLHVMQFRAHEDPMGARARILERLVEAEGAPVPVKELLQAVAHLSPTQASARQLVYRLNELGAIVRCGRGRYCLPDVKATAEPREVEAA
jgi:hypothetical protein